MHALFRPIRPLSFSLISMSMLLASCGGSNPGSTVSRASPSTAVEFDNRCDIAPYPSAEWTRCELENTAKTLEAPLEQLSQPAFLQRASEQSGSNIESYLQRILNDPSWLLLALNGLDDPLQQLVSQPAGLLSLNANTPVTSLTSTYAGPAVSDPYRFPDSPGADGVGFYENEAVVTPVVFYDRDCARLTGNIWRPKNARGKLPGIVINNGSVQAHEPSYWWAAQALVRAGYQVMTFDPRGQGRSDFLTPAGGTGTNINPSVFWLGLVDAIDFFRSSPTRVAPNNARCAASYATETTAFNPEHGLLDPERLGLAGHSLGAIGVSVVQGYGAPGADPWPGQLDTTNPVDVVVAWDGLLRPEGGLVGGAFQGGGLSNLLNTIGVSDPVFRLIIERGLPKFGIRVPAMSQGSDYGILVSPFLSPPDPAQRLKLGFDGWSAAGVPVYDMTLRGSSHFEWSLIVGLPATSWCASVANGHCEGGWGMPAARHYTVAWFDRWLKAPNESGFSTADERLTAIDGEFGRDRMSFRFRSAFDFKQRSGEPARCSDIRAACATSTD